MAEARAVEFFYKGRQYLLAVSLKWQKTKPLDSVGRILLGQLRGTGLLRFM